MSVSLCMVKIKIQRFNPEEDKAVRVEEYEVPYSKGMRVITALQWVQEKHSGDLAFRWNCRAGECGSCAMEVNGRPSLACKTEIKPDAAEVTIAPLKVYPIVKDLVIDRSEAESQLARLKPYFVPSKDFNEQTKTFDEDIRRAVEMRTCIDCLICQDSCHVLREGLEYAGPRNVVKAMAWDYHPHDVGGRALQFEQEGVDKCNVSRCCTLNCPQGIKITQNAIIPIKEKLISEHSLVTQVKRKLFNIQ